MAPVFPRQRGNPAAPGRRWPGVLLLAFGLALGLPPAALRAGDDHPGPDVYFHYELELRRDRLLLLHETRWTDQYAQALRQRLDTDGDGAVSDEEAATFARGWATKLRQRFRLEVQGQPVDLAAPADVNFDIHEPTEEDLARSEDAVAEGAGAVKIYQGISWEFSVYVDYEILLAAEAPVQIDLYEENTGQVEPLPEPWPTNSIRAYGDEGIAFRGGTDPGDPMRLTEHIEFTYDWSGRGPAEFDWQEYQDPNKAIREALYSYVLRTGWAFLVGLILAFGYGMGHALAPGHGKAMVAAYLIGTRGRKRDAILLGLIVTLTHTLSVILLAVLMIVVLNAVEVKRVEVWLAVASGAGIAGIGAWLLQRNLRAFLAGRPVGHPHAHAHRHDHPHADAVAGPHVHHHHHHAHEHVAAPHDARAHGERPATPPRDAPPGAAAAAGALPGGSQAPAPGRPPGMPTTLRELVALGVTGGILPCPGALTAFFFSIQFGADPHKALLVVLSFSFGLAVVLVVIGLLMVTSASLLDRMSAGRDRAEKLLQALPVVSAAAITLIGGVITYSSLTLLGR